MKLKNMLIIVLISCVYRLIPAFLSDLSKNGARGAERWHYLGSYRNDIPDGKVDLLKETTGFPNGKVIKTIKNQSDETIKVFRIQQNPYISWNDLFDVREVVAISPGETKEVNLDFKDFPLKNRLCGTIGYFIAMSNVSISDLDGISGSFIFKYPIDRDSIESVAVTLVSNVSVIGTYYSPDKVLRNYYPVNDIFILDKVVTSKEDLSKNFHKNVFMEYRPGERFASSDLVLKCDSKYGLSWDFETRSISSKM